MDGREVIGKQKMLKGASGFGKHHRQAIRRIML
jgi:hypothetical protein